MIGLTEVYSTKMDKADTFKVWEPEVDYENGDWNTHDNDDYPEDPESPESLNNFWLRSKPVAGLTGKSDLPAFSNVTVSNVAMIPPSDGEESQDDSEGNPKTFMRVLTRFAERTSMQGVPYINVSRVWYAKLVWAILFLVGFVAMCFHLYYLFKEYYAYDTHSVVSLGFSTLAFPSITICNINPIKHSNLKLASREIQDFVASVEPSNIAYSMEEKRKEKHRPPKPQPPRKSGEGGGSGEQGNGPGGGGSGEGGSESKPPSDSSNDGTPNDNLNDNRNSNTNDNNNNNNNANTNNNSDDNNNDNTNDNSDDNNNAPSDMKSDNGVPGVNTDDNSSTPPNSNTNDNSNSATNTTGKNINTISTTEKTNANTYSYNNLTTSRTRINDNNWTKGMLSGNSSSSTNGINWRSMFNGSYTNNDSDATTDITSTNTMTDTTTEPVTLGKDTTTSATVDAAATTTFTSTTNHQSVATKQNMETAQPTTDSSSSTFKTNNNNVDNNNNNGDQTNNIPPGVKAPAGAPAGAPNAAKSRRRRFVEGFTISETNSRYQKEDDHNDDPDALKGNKSTLRAIEDEFKFLFSVMDRNLRSSIGHQIDDMLMECSFRGIECDGSYFKLSQTAEYGNCFTLERQDFISILGGPGDGLTLIFFTQDEEYLHGITNSLGFQVHIHQQGSMPNPYEEGISVSAGLETNVALKQVNIERIGLPHGECEKGDAFFNKYGIVYTQKTCQQFCIQTSVMEQCRCYDNEKEEMYRKIESYQQTNITEACLNYNQSSCLKTVYAEFQTGSRSCSCLSPCQETIYTKFLSSKQWPAEHYTTVLVEHLCNILNETECTAYASKSRSDLALSFLKVVLYFEDLNYENITEEPNYELFQFVSDVGGTIGLWIGLSLISFFEVLQFLYEVVHYLFYVKPRQRAQLAKKMKRRMQQQAVRHAIRFSNNLLTQTAGLHVAQANST